MALYRLEVKVVSRGKQGASMVAGAAYRSGSRLVEHEHGRSAVAASAHLAGDRLEDERGGVVHDFRGKAVVCSEIMLPPGSPESFYDRETLWNRAEAAETRINSRAGREILAVLPRELSDAENLDLVRDFVRESLVERGMCADFAIHAPTASDGLRQPHVHILCSVREVGPDGFGAKVRQWDKRELLTSLRQEWAADCNRSLELAGREERVSHLSLAAQLHAALERGDFERAAEVDRLPGVHLGPAAAAMEREGVRTDIGDELRAIAEENAARAAAYEAVREMAADVPEAPGRFLEMRAASDDPVGAFEQWGEWAREALEQLREMALAAVERVQEAVLSAWDNLVAAMSPMSDFALAERAAAEEREAELDRAIDEVLAEMDTPEPEAGIEPGEQDPEMGAILAELDRDDREHEAEIEVLEQEHEPSFRDRLAAAMRERTEHNLERATRREPPGLEIEM